MERERVPTGIPGLDDILYGGLMRGDMVLVQGTPGAGKTTLGLQFIHEGIVRYGEPGLVVTFEEVPDQLYRDALNFGWDLRRLSQEGKLRVIPTSPSVFRQQIESSQGLIWRSLYEMGVQRVLIDSITHFNRITSDPVELRELVNQVLNLLRQGELTAFLVGEIGTGPTPGWQFEEYVVDAVIRLSYEWVGDHVRRRFLEVVKARGQDFLSGRHVFCFEENGIRVYPTPRPLPLEDKEGTPSPSLERVSTGIEGLDIMMEGGMFRGFSLLVAGGPGTGKTSFGLQFIHEGARLGERGLIVSLSARPAKVMSLSASIGLDLQPFVEQGLVSFLYRFPTGLNAHELFFQIQQRVEEGTVQRLLFDSLSDLQTGMTSRSEFHDYVYSLLDLLGTHGVTSVLTTGLEEGGGQEGQVDPTLAMMVDAILLLRFEELHGRRRKMVSLLKMRGTDHDAGSRGFKITSHGVVVEAAFIERELFR